MTETLCTAAQVEAKAGLNVSSDITSTQYTQFINEAEAIIMTESRENWVGIYATLDSTYKIILQMAASSLAAIFAINFDMSGYTSRVEAQTMLDVNSNMYNSAIKLLREKSPYIDFIKKE